MGVKAGPLRKKELFLKLFFILLQFKNKNYFTLDNLSKYGHITLKFVGGEMKKLSKSVFGYFKTKKKIQAMDLSHKNVKQHLL